MTKEGTVSMTKGKKLSNETKKRIQVLASKGLDSPEISRALGISENSVKRYKNGGEKTVKKIVKSKKKAGGSRGNNIKPADKSPVSERQSSDRNQDPSTINGDNEKIEFIGGKKNMSDKKTSEAEDSFNICGSCGAEVKGTPEKCPSCGAEFDYSE